MAREHSPSVSDSGGARRAVALAAALLLVASAVAPVSVAAAVGTDDTHPTTASNDRPTAVANDETTAVELDDGGTAGNDGGVAIRGRVVHADGAPAANATVLLGDDDRNRTDAKGRFSLRGERNRTYDLTYRQVANGSAPRDGVPDAYAVGRVNASTDRTLNVTLPEASPLNVTVAAENRTAVDDATVRVTHARDGANATLDGRTDRRGRLVVGGRVGVELAGNATVAVEAPNASLFDESASLAVENATDADVVLELNDTDPPTLDYEVRPRTANVSEPVTFDATDATDESGVAETTWTIAGQPWNTPRVDNAFGEPGNYSVDLGVTDWAGNRNATTVEVSVVDERPPDADLAANATTVTVNESVRFDARNATDNHRIAEYRWAFGDGATAENATDPTVSHRYAVPGTYNATVVVVDASGNRANATRQVAVERQPPNASFTVSDPTPEIGEEVTFDASPSVAAGNVSNYSWEFEDGPSVPDQRVFTTSFPDSGTYEVTLVVTDEFGRSDELARTVEVPNKPPKADAGRNRSVAANASVELDGSYSTDPDDEGLRFEWNQTAGPEVTLSAPAAVSPTFTAPDVNDTTALEFELAVADDHGANDTDAVAVTVEPGNDSKTSNEPGTDNETSDDATTGESEESADGDSADGSTAAASSSGGSTAASGGSSAASSGGGSTGGASSGGSTGGSSGGNGGGASDDGAESASSDESGGTAAASESGADGSDGDPTPTPTVSVERVEGANRVVATVEDADAGDPARLRLPDDFAANGAAFESVSVAAGAPNVSLSVAASGERPEGTPASDADEVLSYLDVTERGDGGVESARFRFRVAADALDARGVPPEAVRLYRYDGDEWETLATNVTGRADGEYRFEATSPGFSVFAVGAASPPVAVTDAALATGAVAPGESVRVTATVENDGTDERTAAVTLTANGSAVAETRTTVPANGTRTVTFTPSFESPGLVELAVEGASAGTLSVSAVAGTDSESGDGDASGDDAGDGDESDRGPGERTSGGPGSNELYLGLFAAALLGAALWGYLLS